MSDRPSRPPAEAPKLSFVEQKAKELREDLKDLLEGGDFSSEVHNFEEQFGEKIDREGFIEAFSHIYLAIVEGRLLRHEEWVTFEILDAMRIRAEYPDPLWLRTLTGQIVAGFMKGLASAQLIVENQEPDPVLQEVDQIYSTTREERRFEIADAFFKVEGQSAKSMLMRLLATSTRYVQELETKMVTDEKGEAKMVRSEFILPWLPIRRIPPLEMLQDRWGRYRMAYVNEDVYFPEGEARRREDFELTTNDLKRIKYPAKKRSQLLTDLKASHQERFPFCMEFDIKEALKERKKFSFTSSELFELITEGKGKRYKYLPASIDHHLALAAFGWSETEDHYVTSLGSAVSVGEDRYVPGVWHRGDDRGLDLVWLGSDWRARGRFLVLRGSSS